jgi:sn-glycerol 3-phosphate transport system substrate-binding protein
MQRHVFLKTLAAAAALAATGLLNTAGAQTPLEVPFYYPVAVGGPITKVIDGYAAEFNRPIRSTASRPSMRAPTRKPSSRR